MQDNGVQSIDLHEARDALERFVMENDELLDLEAHIGRFNIFDALGMVNAEIRHSNFLGWLLDPAESHGAGDLFLKAIVMDMLRETAEDLRPKGVSPIDLDGAQIASVEIRREWKNIDLLIHCESPKLVIAIENKVRSAEHSGQLARYKQIVRDAFPGEPAMFVFLTREGDEPSDEEWTTYSYADIKRVLERVRRANEGAIGDDVATFLDHYLHLIGSRLMDDEVIDDLCKKIYKNHRQAIDLIRERVAGNRNMFRTICLNALRESPEHWWVVQEQPGAIAFLPRSLDTYAERIASSHQEGVPWIRGAYICRDEAIHWRFVIRESDDTETRNRIVETLLTNGKSLGMRSIYKNPTIYKRVRLASEAVYKPSDLAEVDLAHAEAAVRKHLHGLRDRFERIAVTIRECIDAPQTKKNPRSSQGL